MKNMLLILGILWTAVGSSLELECTSDIHRTIKITAQNHMTVTTFGEFPERVEGFATVSTLLGFNAKKYHLSASPQDYYFLSVGDLGEIATLEWRAGSVPCQIKSH